MSEVHDAVPDGYRQGLITAITVLLGFSLSFLRYWYRKTVRWFICSAIALLVGLSLALVEYSTLEPT